MIIGKSKKCTDDVLAKNKLLGHDCKNCFYMTNKYKSVNIDCLKLIYDNLNKEYSLMNVIRPNFLHDDEVCDTWVGDISKKDEVFIDFNFQSGIHTHHQLNEFIEVVEKSKN